MARLTGFLVVLLVLCLASEGFGCDVKDITVRTVKSGRIVSGKPEWNVKVTNTCTCPVKTIVLSCPDFQSVKPVNEGVLKKNEDRCLLYSGVQLAAGGHLDFSYAWDHSFDLPALYILPMGC